MQNTVLGIVGQAVTENQTHTNKRLTYNQVDGEDPVLWVSVFGKVAGAH